MMFDVWGDEVGDLTSKGIDGGSDLIGEDCWGEDD